MKTVKVRIAVAVDPSGQWTAAGWPNMEHVDMCAVDDLGPGESYFWVEAELPIPEITTVEGTTSVAPNPNLFS